MGRQDLGSCQMLRAKLTQILSSGISYAARASVQWPAVKKTWGAMRVPEHHSRIPSPNRPSRSTMIAPTYGWVVSGTPYVMAPAGVDTSASASASTRETRRASRRTEDDDVNRTAPCNDGTAGGWG